MLFIFGASGDLAKRKLFPSLTTSKKQIIAFARHDYSKNFQEILSSYYQYDKKFLDNIKYIKGEYTDLSILNSYLQTFNVYYLALPPNVYLNILPEIYKLTPGIIAVEKPYGDNVYDVRKLRSLQNQHMNFKMILIDHYLLKPLSIVIPEFLKNSKISEILNNRYVSEIKIYGKEKIGVEGRIYFNKYGIIKDIIQNHLSELMCLITSDDANEKMENLRNLKISDDAIFGQYETYREEIEKESNTETYARINAEIETERWKGVKFSMIAGKGLDEKLTQVECIFKKSIFETEIFKNLNLENENFDSKENLKLIFNIFPFNEIFWLNKEQKITILNSQEIKKINKNKYGDLNDYSLIFNSLTENKEFPSADINQAELLWNAFSKFHNKPKELIIYSKGTSGPELENE